MAVFGTSEAPGIEGWVWLDLMCQHDFFKNRLSTCILSFISPDIASVSTKIVSYS